MKYEGINYKFKKNSINRIKKKYSSTYNYILESILKYQKNINLFQQKLNTKKDNINELIITIIENTAKELNLNNKKIYSYKSFNKSMIKHLKRDLKKEKRKKESLNINSINIYKKIKNKNHKELREFAINNPRDFLEGVYLYTICED